MPAADLPALDVLSLWLPAIVAIFAIGGLLAERALIAWRVGWYFRLGLPLGEALVPIPTVPRGAGRTASVRFDVDDAAGEVRFWAQPGDRTSPMALHGVIVMTLGPRGVALQARWAPPWTLVAALLWFGALGATRGMAAATVSVAVLLLVLVGALYRGAAVRAARELRWAFVSGADDDEPR